MNENFLPLKVLVRGSPRGYLRVPASIQILSQELLPAHIAVTPWASIKNSIAELQAL